MKKNTICLLISVILLAACSPGSSTACTQGVCIDVGFRGRIQGWGTAITVITIESDHDINGVEISLTIIASNIKIIRSVSTPEGTELLFQDDKLYQWQFDVLANEIYTITAEIDISPSKYAVMEEGDIALYQIQANASCLDFDNLAKSHGVYLNYLGQEVEPGENHGAEEPAYILTEAITIMPGPTGVIEPTPITPTSQITPSATIDSYPPPVESMFSSTEEALPTGYP